MRRPTTQVFTPDFLSIDLKVSRNSTNQSLWHKLPLDAKLQPYKGMLKVVDDSEAYCISPAVKCEDIKGNERTVLLRGYPYSGSTITGDVITVHGKAVEGSSVVLVTQAAEDLLIPDFTNVPIM